MTIACVGSRLMKSGTTLQKARGKRPLSMFLGMRRRAVTRAAPSHMSQFSLIRNFYSILNNMCLYDSFSTKSLDGCMHIALVCGYSSLFVALGITIHLCSGRQWGTWLWCHSWGHGPEHNGKGEDVTILECIVMHSHHSSRIIWSIKNLMYIITTHHKYS